MRVAVVFGGHSGEHEVSCATAAGVIRALDPQRYDVVPVGITRAGQWVLGPSDPAELEGGRVEITGGAPAVLSGDEDGNTELLSAEPGEAPRSLGDVDVVLPLLHGPFGEDGTVQGMLEMAGARYVGSGVLASAVGMDKHFMKVALEAEGLPVDPYVVISPRRWRTDRAGALADAAALTPPLFVKPCRAGSSLGITRVTDPADLPAAIEEAQRHDPTVIVEQGVPGREIECGVLEGHGDDAPRTAPVGEILLDVPEGAFYDYDTKYFAGEGEVTLQIPADLPEGVSDEIRALAVRSFDALGCEGLARVDFFYTDDARVVVNEVNTMPGFTPFSMFPRMWQAAGMNYPELVGELVALALERPVGLR